MKKVIVTLLAVFFLLTSYSAFATDFFCSKCQTTVTGKGCCSYSSPVYGSYNTCTKGNGCAKYMWYTYLNAVRCPSHSTVKLNLTTRHTHGTHHDVSSHNDTSACPY